MTNTAVTCSIVAREALPILANMLGFSSNVNRDFEDEFTGNVSRGYMPGQTINIKRPPRYTYRAGRVAVPQATTETSIPLTLSQGGCDLNFTSLERTLSFNKLEDKVAAAMEPVANEIDRQGLQLARLATFNTIGTPGTLPTTQALALAAIRETFEETGLIVGHPLAPGEKAPRTTSSAWAEFFDTGHLPALDKLDYVARAITPPYRPIRFHARFFITDADHATGTLGGSGELIDLRGGRL